MANLGATPKEERDTLVVLEQKVRSLPEAQGKKENKQ